MDYFLKNVFLQTTAGHNRGPPQQTYFLGSILFLKKLTKSKKKQKLKNEKTNSKKNRKKLDIVVNPQSFTLEFGKLDTIVHLCTNQRPT